MEAIPQARGWERRGGGGDFHLHPIQINDVQEVIAEAALHCG